jgi:PAS domain S-box-containing protein
MRGSRRAGVSSEAVTVPDRAPRSAGPRPTRRRATGRDGAPQDPEEARLLQAAVDEAARLLEADGGMIYLVDPSSGELRFAHDAGITDDRRRAWVRGLRLAPDQGMFGRAVAERRMVLTSDYPADASFAHTADADRVVTIMRIRSMVVAPLLAEDEVFGALGVFDHRPEAYGEAQIALVRALADHAAAAMANRRLIADLAASRAALARRADAERALREIAARVSAIQAPSALLQLVVDEAAGLLGADGARIDLLDEETGVLEWAFDAFTGRRPGLGPIAEDDSPEGRGAGAGEGLAGLAMRERRAVWTGQYATDARFIHAPAPDAWVTRHGLRSVIAAPMLAGDQPLGTLTVYTKEPEAYGREDAALMEALANQAGVGIRNARLFEAIQRSQAELGRRARAEASLRDIAARITAMREPTEILHMIAAEGARLLRTERVFINLLDDPGGAGGWTWYTPTEVGHDDWPAEEAIAIGEGVTGKAIAERRSFITGDYLHDDRFIHRPGPDRYTAELDLPSALAVPMFDGDTPLGAMLAESEVPDAFTEDDARLLEALARQASIALTNARLFQALTRSREELSLRADSERTLREIATQITAIRDPAELLQGILDAGARLLLAERAQIDLVDPVADLAQWTHPMGTTGSRLPGGMPRHGMAGWAVAAGHAVWTGDYFADHTFRHTKRADRFVRSAGLRSVIATPLLTEAGLLGVIQVGTSRAAAYGPADGELLEGLASQAAVAITNARLIDELERSRSEVTRRADAERALREIAAQVTSLRDPRAVVQLAIRAATRLLGGDVAEIGLIEDPDRLYAQVGATTLPIDPGAEAPKVVPGMGVSGLAFRDAAVVWTGDYRGDDRFDHGVGVDDFLGEHGFRSAISAPLVLEGRPFGAMTVISRQADAFDADDGVLLQALADQASIAIANARLITQLEQSQGELARRAESERALREIAGRITALRDPGEVLARIVDESRRLLASDGAHLTLMHESRRFLVPAVISGASDEASRIWMHAQEFPIDGGMNGLAAGSGEAIWTVDYLTDPRIPHEPDDQAVAARMGIRGMAVAPLRAPGGEIVGTLAVSHTHPRETTPDELEQLQSLADHAAIAVANARLLERVQDSEARYRYLVQSSPDAIWQADADGRFTFFSEMAETLLGRSPADLAGRHFSDVVAPVSMGEAQVAWQQLSTRADLVLRLRFLLRHVDGTEFPTEVSAVPLFEEGVFRGAHGLIRDLRVRERLERDLRASESRFRHLVSASPDLVFELDDEGRFTYASDRIEVLTGRAPDAVLGQHFREILVPEAADQSRELWERLRSDPAGVQAVRGLILASDDRRIPVEIHAVGKTQDGRFAGAHGAVRDLRERDRLERDLRRQAAELAASEERSHLASELHDSVTQALFSMTLVTRTLELLLQKDPTRAAEQLDILRELQRDALAEMRSLVFELRPGSLEQDGLVPALRTHCAAVEGRVGLPVLLDADPFEERLPIELEEGIYRIAQEALHNIVKHAGARQVRIRLTRDARSARLEVEDDGQGFEPDRVPAGHLGLAGMRSRAERLGGRITIASSPGSGTRIELLVPIPAAAAAPAGGSDPLEATSASATVE